QYDYPSGFIYKKEIQVRSLIFITFVSLLLSNRAYANNATYNLESFVWSSNDNHQVGSLVYDGNATSRILTTVNNIIPGVLYVTKSHCKYPGYQLSSARDVVDHYIVIPKLVKDNNGNEFNIEIEQLPSGYTIAQTDTQNYTLYLRGTDNYRYINRYCQNMGDQKNFTDSWVSSFVLSINTENIGVGKYTGNITMKVARVEYYSPLSTWLYRWSLAEINDSFGVVTLPFDINIQNKCSLSHNEILLAHNGHSIISADGHTTSQTININCTNGGSIDLSLSLTAFDKPSKSYTEGVGVGLGNGWDAILKIEGQNISDANPNTKMTIPANSGFNIKSTLRETDSSQAGSLSGSAVLEVFIQ
ncbi:papG chaperone-binding domain protein, partial [Salmonella enterica]|nr:papG chaperone-binding domain protein [Salmonella enterica]